MKDTVVLRRLVRQVMPEEVLALALKQSGLEKRCAYLIVVIYSIVDVTIGVVNAGLELN